MTRNTETERFIKAHPLAAKLEPNELQFAMHLADKHRAIKLYRSGSDIMLSREAMYTPGVREPFYLRRANKPGADLNEIIDLEITVKATMPRAVSRADLKKHYRNDPLRCAKALAKTGGFLGSTSKRFEIIAAKPKDKSNG